MSTRKIYDVINPALKLRILRAELTETGIITYLSKDGITQTETGRFLYSEIRSINISLIDINRTQIAIKSNNSKPLKLISLSVGQLKNGKIQRENLDQKSEFNEWVSELHKMLAEKKLLTQISFSKGSTAKILLLILLLLACLAAIILAITIDKIGLAGLLLVGAVSAGLLLFKMGFHKKYEPESMINTTALL